MTRNLVGGRHAGSVLVSAIESALEAVDRVLAGIPNPVPSSGQLRQARGQVLRTAASPVRRVRRPLLAVIGTVDLLADQTRGFDLSVDLPAGHLRNVVSGLLEGERPLGARLDGVLRELELVGRYVIAADHRVSLIVGVDDVGRHAVAESVARACLPVDRELEAHEVLLNR